MKLSPFSLSLPFFFFYLYRIVFFYHLILFFFAALVPFSQTASNAANRCQQINSRKVITRNQGTNPPFPPFIGNFQAFSILLQHMNNLLKMMPAQLKWLLCHLPP